MTWTTVQMVATVSTWVVSFALVVFAGGRLWQRIRRGEVGDFKLSPLQQIAVDLKDLAKTFEHELKALREQIGTQYTDVVQRVNDHHVKLRELTDAQHTEYERLSQKFYTKEMVNQKWAEVEKAIGTLTARVDEVEGRCFDNHRAVK